VPCDHAYDLAQKFNSLYHQHHILSEDNAEIRSSLLALTRLVREQLQVALNLLGIEVQRRM
jgi:arginyl-tRNA synthetase